MMKFPAIKSTVVLATLLLSACATHEGRPGTAKIDAVAPVQATIVQDFVYTPKGWPQALKADLYKPAGTGPFPAVIMIHGGGWTGRTRDDMYDISRQVAQHGYVVMNISYRFAPQWHFPAQLQDAQQAVIWLRAHAKELHVRENQIGAWGYSAGAHLAALVGVTGPKDRWFLKGAQVQAVVAGGTPVDIRYYKEGKLTNSLTGVPYDQNPDLWRDASPLALVTKDDPPFFLYHGTFDFTVNENNSRVMYEALNAAGVPAELYRMRGLEHLGTFWVNAPVKRGIEFLDLQLRKPGSMSASSAQVK